MRKYYTRPCNFYYGSYAKKIISKGKALPLAGNTNIAFDQIEVFERKGRGKVKNYVYPISKIKKLPRKIKSVIKFDLKNITSKRKNICKINFNLPQIMGVLNITPDSFSDGGLFFNEKKAYNQTSFMIKNGASMIDIGGESTRPGSKIIDDKIEWERIKIIIKKIKKHFTKTPISLDTRKSYVMKKGIENKVSTTRIMIESIFPPKNPAKAP